MAVEPCEPGDHDLAFGGRDAEWEVQQFGDCVCRPESNSWVNAFVRMGLCRA